MRLLITISLLLSGMLLANEGDKSLVYIPQGQMKGNPVKVFVSNVNLRKDDKPILQAFSSNSGDQQAIAELVPVEVIADSEFTGSDKVPRTGTMLLFDFNQEGGYENITGVEIVKWVSGARFYPVVKWGKDQEMSATGAGGEFVLIGSLISSVVSIAIVIAALFAIVLVVSHRHKESALAVLKSGEGTYSLSKAQLLAWTLAATFCVGVFGMAQQELPDIPSTLIALLGLSVLTTGSAYASPPPPGDPAATAAKKKAAKNVESPEPRSVILDLISTNVQQGEESTLSIAKVQMLLWTVISLILFVSKSLIEGALWDIPWELVVLMGVSQTSYIVPKYWTAPKPRK